MSIATSKSGMARIAVVLGTLAVFMGAGSVQAEEQPSEDQILRALKPRVTRSLTGARADPAKAVEERRIIDDALQQSRTRSLSSAQREQVAAVAKEKPKIDLESHFGYKSPAIASPAE